MSDPAEWSPLRTEDGSWTLRAPGHGEACHSRSGAWGEALVRFAGGCRLRARVAEDGLASLRVLDVGTGLGLNLDAALATLTNEDDRPVARLDAVTLERDPGVIRAALALAQPAADARAARASDRVRRALARGLLEAPVDWDDDLPRGELRLLLGDARETLLGIPEGPRFDAVFLDPFSPAREPELWEPAFLASIARRMAPGSLLSTYSAAFAVRLALARAGLVVGRGPAYGRKTEGTLASPDRALPPLEARVVGRLRRELASRGDSGRDLPHPSG